MSKVNIDKELYHYKGKTNISDHYDKILNFCTSRPRAEALLQKIKKIKIPKTKPKIKT